MCYKFKKRKLGFFNKNITRVLFRNWKRIFISVKMLLSNFLFYILFNISLDFYDQKLLVESVINLTDVLAEVTPNLNLTLIPPKCIQMRCKFVCFNGKSTEIEKDILLISKKNNHFCSNVEELRLYNSEFPDNKLSYGFLGTYSDKVDVLYVAAAKITDIAAGAFAQSRLKKIYFENLHLKELKKDFFKDITYEFNTLSIIQKEMPVQLVHLDFLDYVKFQIKSLTLQAGLKSVCNLTGGDVLLNNLVYTDFSHNNFGMHLINTSFSKVSAIEHLDLSHSNLESLPAYLFAGLSSTFKYLDLSYNKLKTISRNIFGCSELPHDLKIHAKDNEWSCSCALQHEMKSIFVYYPISLFCSEPQCYAGWSVFDDKLCAESSLEDFETVQPTNETTTKYINMTPTTVKDDNEYDKSTTIVSANIDNNSSFKKPQDYMKLDCLASPINITERISHIMEWPLIVFKVLPQKDLRVKIVIDYSEKPYDSFSLIWFNKATTKYYKMEINYNEYGLGCNKAISLVTIVENLLPSTSYTFCLVFQQRLNVSPFNCKSIHVSGDLGIQNSAWLTRDMKKAGLPLIVFGIIMFLFVGILMIYLLLKRKPILLKGSKRVMIMHSNSDDIVVLPKERSISSIKEKEKHLARFDLFNYSQRRRKSNDSEVSYQSYIDTNLYEVIPPVEKQNSNSSAPPLLPDTTEESTLAVINNQDSDSCYLTPLESVTYSSDFAEYAKILYRAKRNYNDALPQVPTEEAPLSSKSQTKPESAHIGNIYILDSQV